MLATNVQLVEEKVLFAGGLLLGDVTWCLVSVCCRRTDYILTVM